MERDVTDGDTGAGEAGAEEALAGEIVDDGGDPPLRTGGAGPAVVTFDATVVAGAVKQHRDLAAPTFGSVLVVVGAVLLAGRFNDVVAVGGAALWIGLGFLTWWAFRGTYGLLVPASVLTGLGLGVGFLAIYALDAVRLRGRSSWWHLVPGVVIVAVGLMQDTSGWDALGELGWPLLLIVVGLIIVGGALSRRRPPA